MGKRTVGTCGSCGGAVTEPDPWWGINPPPKRCESCGREPVEQFGPVLPMKPLRPVQLGQVGLPAVSSPVSADGRCAGCGQKVTTGGCVNPSCSMGIFRVRTMPGVRLLTGQTTWSAH